MLKFVFTRFRTGRVSAGLMLLLLISPLSAQKKEAPPREQIGQVLGKPVYRDEIPAGTDRKLRSKLRGLFYTPVFEKYYKNNKTRFELTKQEIVSATAYFSEDEDVTSQESRYRKQIKEIDSQLNCPGIAADEKRRLEQKRLKIQLEYKQDSLISLLLSVAEYDNFERHLYKKYGGGRIRFTLMGTQAFDATHQWLEDQEEKGEFKIIDPELRTAFYHHWTDAVKQDGISNDKEVIREWLLKPDWAPKAATKK